MIDRDNDLDQRPIKKRTALQNRSLHLYFTQVAEALNAAGLERKVTLNLGADVPWTPETIKEVIWRTIQYKQTGKLSTTELSTTEYEKVYDTVNRFLGESFGVYVPLPSEESLAMDRKLT